MFLIYGIIKFLIKIVLIIGVSLAVLVAGFYFILNVVTSPSNTRDWNDDQDTLPYAEISGNSVNVHNIRNFTYASTTSYTRGFYDKTFDLSAIKRVWYVVEPFSGIPGSAHTFLSFEFEGNQFVSISVEIRKEKGESFHPIKGLLNRYELMYVIGDERDLIKLRSNYRKDEVFVYPIKTSTEKARELFVDMLGRVNGLHTTPEFYNTLTNTCTTNIARHVNHISPSRIPFYHLGILFPAHSDELAYTLGLLDTDLSFTEARERFHINTRALKYADAPDFSVKIRGAE
jgi:hypothetical protein